MIFILNFVLGAYVFIKGGSIKSFFSLAPIAVSASLLLAAPFDRSYKKFGMRLYVFLAAWIASAFGSLLLGALIVSNS